jgi:GR25 family glycosyltransferase involved in LPS biosynthesis
MPTLLEIVDHIYFINLTHRQDRAADFYKTMESIGIARESITRIPAFYEPDIGALGCTKSHIFALEKFLTSTYESVLIFEDDFEITSRKELDDFCRQFLKTPPPQWDVLLFSGVLKEGCPTDLSYLIKVKELQTSSSYMIKKRYAPILLENMKEGREALETYYLGTGRAIPDYCLDMYWKSLQNKDNWFLTNPILGYQRPSYSDIQKKEVDYTHEEMNLNPMNKEPS